LRSKDGGIFYAVGQGALGLEIRKGDEGIRGLVEGLGDVRSTLACLAERALLRTLEGGCSVPIGVQTEWVGGELGIEGVVVSLDGRECVRDGVQAEVSGVDEAEALGVKLAARLVEGGAESILKDIVVNRPAKE
jgi:hydroxymethylbilane synthase